MTATVVGEIYVKGPGKGKEGLPLTNVRWGSGQDLKRENAIRPTMHDPPGNAVVR